MRTMTSNWNAPSEIERIPVCLSRVEYRDTLLHYVPSTVAAVLLGEIPGLGESLVQCTMK